MAIENRTGVDLPAVDHVGTVAVVALKGTVAFLAVATWVYFWALVARIHLRMGHLPTVGVIAILLVLPAVGGLGYYLLAVLSMD